MYANAFAVMSFRAIYSSSLQMHADTLSLHCIVETLRRRRRKVSHVDIVILLQLLEIRQDALCDQLSRLLATLPRCAGLL
jgi:hypothetical protein